MLGTGGFNQLFQAHVAQWTVWRAARRDPERVPKLARARLALEDARSAIAAEREALFAPARGGDARTSVSADDRARLKVLGTGYQQN